MAPKTVLVRERLSAELADVTPDVVVAVDVRQISELLEKLFPAVLADVLPAHLMDRDDVVREAEFLAKRRVAEFTDVRSALGILTEIVLGAKRLKGGGVP